MDDIQLDIVDLAHGIVTSYLFWSILHAFPAVLWFFPLNELAISGYEVFGVAYLIPIILIIPAVRKRLCGSHGRSFLKLLMLVGILSFHTATLRQRLCVLCIGLMSGILRLGVDMATFDLHSLESRIWSYPIGYIAFLTSRMFTLTQMPAWTNKGLNIAVFTIGLISLIEELSRDLFPSGSAKVTVGRLRERCPSGLIGAGIGALFFLALWIFGEASIVSRWAVTPQQSAGPYTANPWDIPVLACLAFGMVLSRYGCFHRPETGLIATAGFYFMYYTSGWLAYIVGLYLAVFVGAAFPIFFRIMATQSINIGKTLTAAMLMFTPPLFYSVWTVAYNFVPGGTLTREFSGLLIFVLIVPICLLLRADGIRQAKNPTFSEVLPIDGDEDGEKAEEDYDGKQRTAEKRDEREPYYDQQKTQLDINENILRHVDQSSGQFTSSDSSYKRHNFDRNDDITEPDGHENKQELYAAKGDDTADIMKQRNPIQAMNQLVLREKAQSITTIILMILVIIGTLQTINRYANYRPMTSSDNGPIRKDTEAGGHELKVMVWAYHFGYDNGGWPSLTQTVQLLKQIDADVIVMVETDSTKPIMGNIDHTQYLAEVLNYHADFGPSPKCHTWGIALFSRYPILRTVHHLMPSPHGELAPSIEAVLNVRGQQVAILGAHFGNTEDDLDRKLQAEYAANVTARIQMESSLPVAFLGYVTSKPYNRDHKRLLEHGKLKDIDPTDEKRYCLYILYNGLIRRSYARISHGDLSDTEVQFGRFRIPLDPKNYADNKQTVTNPLAVPEDLRLTNSFGGYYEGPWNGSAVHRYHMKTPKYFV